MDTRKLKNSNYSLAVGEPGRARLEVLNAIHNPHTLGLLRALSLPAGAKVLELGCGTGLLSAELANWVGPEVDVLAVDISEEQLMLARAHAQDLGLVQLHFKQMAAEAIAELDGQFDLIVARFLLCHLKEPQRVLEGCTRVLRPGGHLFLEELSGIDSMTCYPPSEAFETFVNMAKKQIAFSGTDFEIGCKLWSHLGPLGFDLIHYQFHQPLLKDAYERSVLTLGVVEGAARLVEAGLWDGAEVEPLLAGLRELEQDPIRMPSYGRSAQILLKKQ